MTPRLRLVVATGNPHKLDELRALLTDLPVRILGLDDLPPERRPEMPEETGTTFHENADLKAAHVARATRHYALADDSGFLVHGLDGCRPGVRSARYAGVDGDRRTVDLANNRKVIAEARERGIFDGREPDSASFVCVLTVAAPDGRVVCWGEGVCDGVLVEEARGTGGFGYDPHFLVPDLGLTFAEMGAEEKSRISHRARALADLRRSLVPLLQDPGTTEEP